jgi:hypothetical protein
MGETLKDDSLPLPLEKMGIKVPFGSIENGGRFMVIFLLPDIIKGLENFFKRKERWSPVRLTFSLF